MLITCVNNTELSGFVDYEYHVSIVSGLFLVILNFSILWLRDCFLSSSLYYYITWKDFERGIGTTFTEDTVVSEDLKILLLIEIYAVSTCF